MDPIIDTDWLGCKNEPPDESPSVGNFARSWQWREMGINPAHSLSNKTVMHNIAEDVLVQKQLKIKSCDLPGFPRSTFLMVFSPDGTKVASTHGNHNVYVSELASGKHVRILTGHPRTPWCIAFHPSHPQLIGSGCLGGQVRVWDLSGGSEVWRVDNETVIASIAFHPRDQLLVIATFNELYFWDWSQPAPFTKVCTNNINEKVRYVAFDSLGYKLITGISVWPAQSSSNSLLQNISHGNSSTSQANTRRESPGDGSPGSRNQESTGTAQEMIVNSYQNLVQRYDSLVRNYQRLFMARHHLTNTPSTNTTDRGTDPMETDTSLGSGTTSNWNSRTAGASGSRERNNEGARRHESESGDGESSSSRLLNLDVLSINPSRSTDSNGNSTPNQERSVFGSRSSAFQRFLHENPERARNLIREPAERTTRWLPNPFSSSTSNPPARSNTVTFTTNAQPSLENNAGSSRTSVFTSHRFDSSAASFFAYRRRNMAHAQNSVQTSTSTNTSPPTTVRVSPVRDEPRSHSERPRTSRSTGSQRPTMTNSSTQISPVAAQTINESLDLIRDILRDSGTRLLNLITNMSLSTLASVERSIPRRRHTSHSDDSEGQQRSRHQRPRIRLFSSSLRREFLSSESDSDSDHSLQVNLSRTRNPSYQEDGAEGNSNSESRNQPTDRMVVELDINDNDDAPNESNDSNRRFNVSVSSNRFRVRSHSTDENRVRDGPNRERRGAGNDDRSQTSSANIDPSRPSTSRDSFLIEDVLNMAASGPSIPSDEAFRKVRAGVNALHRHTVRLTDMWLRGSRTSMLHLRAMWENLRRRVLSLHRQAGRTDVPSYYTRGLMERCRFLAEMARSPRSSPNRSARAAMANLNTDEPNEDSQQTQMSTDSTSSSIITENEQSTSAGPSTGTNRTRPSARRASQLANLYSLYKLSARRRLQSGYRWRAEDETRRRSRGSAPASGRWCLRHGGRPGRRDNARSFELHCTRNEIRMRAMQVLSIMFNMMMSCLEERGLSQLIIHMLRTLKKALALTCLMLMTNRLDRRENETTTSAANDDTPNANESENSQEPEEPPPENNQTTENVQEPVGESMNTQEEIETNAAENADRINDSNSTSSWPTSDSDDDNKDRNKNKVTPKESESEPSTSQTNTQSENATKSPSPQPTPHPWSNRLAVQISVANRNNSATARNRRDVYLEIKRQKALHRTNPSANPITRRKILPPASTYRIPEVRSLPVKRRNKAVTAKEEPTSCEEPVAGPSNAQPGPSTENNSSSPRDPSTSRMNEAEHRVNMFRIAHMHAVRLRTAARTRLRRLQTIRLYTPSSVREMFAIQSNNNDSQSSQPLLNYASDLASRRQAFHAYRPHILATRNDSANRESSQQFESILNNVAVPLVQVNDLPVEGQGPQPQRMPRVHEYLQPIILAQNALVVEDGPSGIAGGPPMPPIPPGLFEAGLVPEALPAPTHRVQAWDFTTGDTPDIADSTKNVVVQRCRIHNDASIDISKDGRLLVALLPVPRLRQTSHWLGVYSLEWGRLGQCLHTAVLEQSAVSVALSPTARHLAVGLGSRRFTTLPHARNNVFALLYRLEPLESSSRTGLSPIKELEQNWEQGFTSLNCLRWAPQPGQGLVYANNTGQLIIMS